MSLLQLALKELLHPINPHLPTPRHGRLCSIYTCNLSPLFRLQTLGEVHRLGDGTGGLKVSCSDSMIVDLHGMKLIYTLTPDVICQSTKTCHSTPSQAPRVPAYAGDSRVQRMHLPPEEGEAFAEPLHIHTASAVRPSCQLSQLWLS